MLAQLPFQVSENNVEKRKGKNMTNNDILRRLRYIENLRDQELISIFELGQKEVSKDKISKWLKKDDHPEYEFINDEGLSSFLNGLIIKLRGPQESQTPIAEKKLTNNLILRKISIAYQLRSDDILAIMKLANFHLGKSELSAFFRKPEHKNYRECKQQILRNFLQGLQMKKRETT